MEFDPETFRIPGALPVAAPAKAKRGGAEQTYLGARPPMWWLKEASEQGKAALATGLALWFKHGVRKGGSKSIRVDASLRKLMNLSNDQASRGVHALDKAGLAKIDHGGRGRCAVVTIITDAMKPNVESA